jgi:YhcH/YjgK/YiaL family protein
MTTFTRHSAAEAAVHRDIPAMIIDSLDRFRDYLGVHPFFARVAEFLETTDLEALADGRHEIGAEGCFALVSQYRTLAPGEGFIECHRRHIDIQILVSGVERVGVCRRGECAATSWDEAGDFEVLEGKFDLVTLRPGSFAVFLPQDGHMPKLNCGAAATVRKVVVKVPVSSAPTVR